MEADKNVKYKTKTPLIYTRNPVEHKDTVYYLKKAYFSSQVKWKIIVQRILNKSL